MNESEIKQKALDMIGKLIDAGDLENAQRALNIYGVLKSEMRSDEMYAAHKAELERVSTVKTPPRLASVLDYKIVETETPVPPEPPQ